MSSRFQSVQISVIDIDGTEYPRLNPAGAGVVYVLLQAGDKVKAIWQRLSIEDEPDESAAVLAGVEVDPLGLASLPQYINTTAYLYAGEVKKAEGGGWVNLKELPDATDPMLALLALRAEVA